MSDVGAPHTSVLTASFVAANAVITGLKHTVFGSQPAMKISCRGLPQSDKQPLLRSHSPRLFSDLEVVRLVRDFDCPDGTIRKGTIGTVLQIFDGNAYQVEFEGEHEIPETIPAELLEPVNVEPA